jgi:MFS transporter, Spinster family, sphingosine-1-phosphate transporter
LERVRGLDLARADFLVGSVTVAAGLAGTFTGGYLGDRLSRRVRQGHLWLSGISALLAIFPAWLALTAASAPVYQWAFFAAEFLLFLSTGPINVVIVNAVQVSTRAMAMAVSIFVIHALGDAIAPPLIGIIADTGGLERAVLVVPLAVAASGMLWIATAAVATE